MWAAGALVVVAGVAIAATIAGGGKELKKSDPNFQSGKIITGGGTTNHSYEFVFIPLFTVCDVTVRMEDENGKEITPGANDGMTQISVRGFVNGTPQSGWQTQALGTTSNGKIDLSPQVPGGGLNSLRVMVNAKSTASAVKFSMSFSTKPPAQFVSCTNVSTYDAGTFSIVARPILEDNNGLIIPITNTSEDDLTFGRFELVGSMPEIASVSVPDTTFTATMDGDHAFVLAGDELDPDETIEVFIEFEDITTTRGAVIMTFGQN
jgi:hypothetical protein